MMFLTLAFVACQNEEILDRESVNVENETSIQLVLIEGENVIPFSQARSEVGKQNYALKFADEDVYASTMAYLEGLSTKERIAFVKELGLESLQELSVIADAELEVIGANASNEADFREKYKAYKEKYAGILVANSYNADDLSLYVPDGDNLNTYLMNNTKNIVVGNEIRKIELVNDMGESDKKIYASEQGSRAVLECGFQEKYDSKKTTCTLTLNPADLFVNVSIGIQKKMWYGWKRDNNRDIYYHVELTNFVYNFWGQYDNQVNISCPALYVFKDTGKIDYKTGYYWSGGNGTMSGTIYVWTDFMTETTNSTYNGVVMDKSLQQNVVLPTCNRSKAYSTSLYFEL